MKVRDWIVLAFVLGGITAVLLRPTVSASRWAPDPATVPLVDDCLDADEHYDPDCVRAFLKVYPGVAVCERVGGDVPACLDSYLMLEPRGCDYFSEARQVRCRSMIDSVNGRYHNCVTVQPEPDSCRLPFIQDFGQWALCADITDPFFAKACQESHQAALKGLAQAVARARR